MLHPPCMVNITKTRSYVNTLKLLSLVVRMPSPLDFPVLTNSNDSRSGFGSYRLSSSTKLSSSSVISMVPCLELSEKLRERKAYWSRSESKYELETNKKCL